MLLVETKLCGGFLAFFRVFDPFIPASADDDFLVCLIPAIIPLLPNPMILDAGFKTTKLVSATNEEISSSYAAPSSRDLIKFTIMLYSGDYFCKLI